MNIDLSGKRALVGGASKGIGKAIAHELAQLGASVTIMARSRDLLQTEVKALPQTIRGQKHHYLVVDFTKPENLIEQVNTLLDGGPIHILVNNTGGPPGGPIIEATAAEFLQAFQNHLICNQLLAKALVPGMKQEHYGRIINIISTSVKQPIPGLGVSNTTRGAVASWAKTLATELGQYGITVNNVLPGFTNTDRLSSIIETRAGKSGSSQEAIATQMKALVPAGRFGAPEETAAAAAFLASPAAGYINGINLPVDGGRTSSL